jgi:hypothetical protein
MSAKIVPCQVDLEATQEHFHAHVDLGDVEVGPGDAVLVRGLPSRIALGEKRTFSSQAEVNRAGPLRRAWTMLVGRFGLQDLYDVGFEG